MAKNTENIETAETIEVRRRDDEGGGFLLGNTKTLGIIGLVLLAVVGAVAYYLYRGAASNDEAQLALSRIRPYYDRGEYAVAIGGDSSKTFGTAKIIGLRQIVDEWGGTSAGKLAALYLGNCYLALGQPEKAREPYTTATGADAELISSAAHAGLGAVAEAAGKHDQAADEYEKAASADRLELNTAEYLVGAARNYERAKKTDEAIKHYRTVATQYASSPANTQARLALARHNVNL
jgi:tetratricopeptide (TPR) repeat protein